MPSPQAHLAFLAHAARQPGLTDAQVDAIISCLLEHETALHIILSVRGGVRLTLLRRGLLPGNALQESVGCVPG